MNPFQTALARLRDAAKACDAAEAARDEARTEVQRLMTEQGIDEAAVAGVGSVTWRQSKGRQTTDWESVAKDLGATPEQIAARTAEKPGPRTFRFTPV